MISFLAYIIAPWSSHNFLIKAISNLYLARTRDILFKERKNEKNENGQSKP